MGAAGKIFGGFASLILSAEAGVSAAEALQKDEYAKCIQKSMESLAFGIIGYRFSMIGLLALQNNLNISAKKH